MKDYALLSMNLTYKKHVRSLLFEPFLGIRNLTNTQYFDNIRINAFGSRFYESAPGRNYYLGVKVKLK
ncbi:TonB-dependent receptor [Fulvivirga imtechensis]|nr:TonB-dependent receptor [Fulvivirga imtechensis]